MGEAEGGDAEAGLESLERSLREALRPADLPEGFAARLQDRVAARQRQRAWERLWRGAVAAVLLLAMLLGGWGLERRRERRERVEAARASAQFALAMQVTMRSLGKVGTDLTKLEVKGSGGAQ